MNMNMKTRGETKDNQFNSILKSIFQIYSSGKNFLSFSQFTIFIKDLLLLTNINIKNGESIFPLLKQAEALYYQSMKKSSLNRKNGISYQDFFNIFNSFNENINTKNSSSSLYDQALLIYYQKSSIYNKDYMYFHINSFFRLISKDVFFDEVVRTHAFLYKTLYFSVINSFVSHIFQGSFSFYNKSISISDLPDFSQELYSICSRLVLDIIKKTNIIPDMSSYKEVFSIFDYIIHNKNEYLNENTKEKLLKNCLEDDEYSGYNTYKLYNSYTNMDSLIYKDILKSFFDFLPIEKFVCVLNISISYRKLKKFIYKPDSSSIVKVKSNIQYIDTKDRDLNDRFMISQTIYYFLCGISTNIKEIVNVLCISNKNEEDLMVEVLKHRNILLFNHENKKSNEKNKLLLSFKSININKENVNETINTNQIEYMTQTESENVFSLGNLNKNINFISKMQQNPNQNDGFMKIKERTKRKFNQILNLFTSSKIEKERIIKSYIQDLNINQSDNLNKTDSLILVNSLLKSNTEMNSIDNQIKTHLDLFINSYDHNIINHIHIKFEIYYKNTLVNTYFFYSLLTTQPNKSSLYSKDECILHISIKTMNSYMIQLKKFIFQTEKQSKLTLFQYNQNKLVEFKDFLYFLIDSFEKNDISFESAFVKYVNPFYEKYIHNEVIEFKRIKNRIHDLISKNKEIIYIIEEIQWHFNMLISLILNTGGSSVNTLTYGIYEKKLMIFGLNNYFFLSNRNKKYYFFTFLSNYDDNIINNSNNKTYSISILNFIHILYYISTLVSSVSSASSVTSQSNKGFHIKQNKDKAEYEFLDFLTLIFSQKEYMDFIHLRNAYDFNKKLHDSLLGLYTRFKKYE